MIGCPTCARLKQQVADLRREFGQEMRAADMVAVGDALGLTPTQSRIALTLFYAGDWVHSHALEKRLDMDGNSLKTHICRIRRVAGDDLIESRYAIGYRLGMEGRARVLEAVG